eukprot:1733299-Alexandrium_andersonii.AAC.1
MAFGSRRVCRPRCVSAELVRRQSHWLSGVAPSLSFRVLVSATVAAQVPSTGVQLLNLMCPTPCRAYHINS